MIFFVWTVAHVEKITTTDNLCKRHLLIVECVVRVKVTRINLLLHSSMPIGIWFWVLTLFELTRVMPKSMFKLIEC